MNDSLEKLALSCTFSLVDGRLAQLEEAFSGHGAALSLQPDFLVDSKYRVNCLIGKGGMGAVYKVHHELLLKDMALKTICTNSLSPEAWQRFQREAQAIGKLRHKNIVEVFDFGIAQGELPYYTMELLQGESLAERLARLGPCDPALALNIFIQVADAMAHAHRQQIVHRDIKPANIFLAERYGSQASQAASSGASALVKIVDFGIAKLASGATADRQYLTTVGTVFGSPLYMSPEQSMGVEVDQRSDIYSFGCSLFHALAGRPPFVGDNAFMTLMSHQGETPPSLKDVNAECQSPQRLDSVVQKLLAKNPDERFQTFEEVQDELSYCLGAIQARESGSKYSSAHWQAIGPGSGSAVQEGIAKPSSYQKILLCMVALSVIVAIGFIITSYTASRANLSTKVQKVAPAETQLSVNTAPAANRQLANSSPRAVEGQNKVAVPPFPVHFSNGPSGRMKTFFFPLGDNHCSLQVGTLAKGDDFYLNFPGTKAVPCSGEYTVPADALLKFVGHEDLSPEFIQRFGPDDLFEVVLADVGDHQWTLAHIEAISHLHGLRELNICKAELGADAVPYINNLLKLKELKVSETNITGVDLLTLSILPKLRVLEVSKMQQIPLLLRRMPKSDELSIFFASCDGLKDDDMPYLVRFPNLENIGLEGNEKITFKGLKLLEPLSHLRNISVSPLGPEIIEPLSHFHQLDTLRMDMAEWSQADRNRLKALQPGCKYYPNDEKKLDF